MTVQEHAEIVARYLPSAGQHVPWCAEIDGVGCDCERGAEPALASLAALVSLAEAATEAND